MACFWTFIYHENIKNFVSSIAAFCIGLRWLAHPCRYGEMISRFGRSVSDFLLVFNSLMTEVPTLFYKDPVMKELKRHFLFIIVQTCWGFTEHVV